MKTKSLCIIILLLITTSIWAQVNKTPRIPMIGEFAPSFTAQSTNGILNFPADLGDHWKVLLSHPADFTPVCSSEILELAYAQKEFDQLNAKLVIVSTDDIDAHKNWKNSLETLSYKGREPAKISFPLVDDHSRAIAYQYGMIHPNSGTTKDVRCVFIIDPFNVVRALLFYPATTGRNIEEVARTIKAIQTFDRQALLTPANWTPGADVLIPYVRSGDHKMDVIDKNHYEVAWYMIFEKMNKNNDIEQNE